MRLTVFWEDILHYHAARIRALHEWADQNGCSVDAVALRSASPELPLVGYQGLVENQIQVLSEEVAGAGEHSAHSKARLLQHLEQSQPDVVAIPGYIGKVQRAALGWCRYHRRGAILMLSTHAADYARTAWREWAKARLVKLFDAAFVSGTPQIAYARQLGLSLDRIFAGYGVVDNAFWQNGAARVHTAPAQWRTRYGLPEHFFLTVSRFVPKKNLSGLLQAYAQYVAQAGSGAWALVIAGDGVLAPMLQRQVADLQLDKLVHFPGYLAAEQMAEVYGLASAFILASDHAEQWGLVVNEAMAAGLPVLVSQICGCVPDLVQEGVTGFRFEPTNEVQLAQLLFHVASDQVDRAQMGCNAQQQIQSYSPERFAQTLWTAAAGAYDHARTRPRNFFPPQMWV